MKKKNFIASMRAIYFLLSAYRDKSVLEPRCKGLPPLFVLTEVCFSFDGKIDQMVNYSQSSFSNKSAAY